MSATQVTAVILTAGPLSAQDPAQFLFPFGSLAVGQAPTRGELPGRVKVAPFSEASPAGPPKLAPCGPPSAGGGSQWGVQTGDANWRQSRPAVRGGFLNRGLPEKQASRPEPAESFAAAPVPEALPPPPPMRGGFFKRRPAGDASHAELPSEPQPQPGQPRVSRNDSQPELHSDGKRYFEGTPEQYFLVKKAAHLVAAAAEAMIKEYSIDAFEAADEAIRLLKQAMKPGQTPCGEIAAHLDRAFLLKATALRKRGRYKDAVDCLTAALKLNKDSHASREARADMNIWWTGMFHLALADLVKLCEVTLPYEPIIPLTTRIITLARGEMAADEQRSARKAKGPARRSSDGTDKPGSRSSTPTTPGSEPVTSERASGDRRRTYHEIIMQIIIWIVQNDTRQMQHAGSRFPGIAPSPHMHACRPHLPAHAPRSFYGS
ncbi:g5082 [Coccomyxa elongata]